MSDDLIGLWSLTDFFIVFENDRPPKTPFGKHPSGFLSYHNNGRMQALLSHHTRSSFPNDLEHAHLASDRDKAQAFNESLSYAGRWSLSGQRITHQVLFATNPQIIGRALVRHVDLLDEKNLHLRYSVAGRSGAINYILKWTKVLESE